MESGKIKSTLNKHTGLLNQEILMIIKENIYISMSKNGKINPVGGVVLFKEMLKLILKKLTLSLLNYQIWMERQGHL